MTVIELLSMLVPLETLAGWPDTPNPSVLQSLGLLVGLPAVAFGVIALIGKASSLSKAGRTSSAPVTDPVWLNAAPNSRQLTAGDGDAAETTSTTAQTGGASARW
jgi:hypothetical protein